MARTLFGHPIRQETTAEFFPDKISLDSFVNATKGIDSFATNMRHFGGAHMEDRYIEEWTEMFLAWSEIEEERPYRKTLTELADQHYEWIKEMGWAGKRTPLEDCALIASEIGEAANECRGDKPTEQFGDELSDVLLRVLSTACDHGIDIEAAIERKMLLNRERGNRGRAK